MYVNCLCKHIAKLDTLQCDFGVTGHVTVACLLSSMTSSRAPLIN